ncbi:MAG: NUDIX domain-containing protein [Proteiniphilum sp.]|jgi:ADP-ribose pyrophosphatase YjhB (NUDIX family)|nr:NUDIX domain-containing protein [Proteiniphilum sp.]
MSASYYQNNVHFLIAVDCIIFGFREKELHVLLTRRPVEPKKNEWSLMGGFMEENESLDQAAEKVLYRYTQQKGIYMEQVGAYGEINRDSGGRVVSVAFYALVQMEKFNTSPAQNFDARWININELPELVFDHNRMVSDALMLLQYKVSKEPLIFKFFDGKFTLPSLQDLYETIYQMPLDKRNFRKKLASMNILDRLEMKDKENSKRGAFFYSFNPGKYELFMKTGKRFSL